MHLRNRFRLAGKFVAALFVAALVHSCSDRDVLSLTVDARGRGVSAMPLIIVKDRGLFEKFGLNVTLLLPQLEDRRGRNSPGWVENLRHRIRWRLGYEQPGGDIGLQMALIDCIFRSRICAALPCRLWRSALDF